MFNLTIKDQEDLAHPERITGLLGSYALFQDAENDRDAISAEIGVSVSEVIMRSQEQGDIYGY